MLAQTPRMQPAIECGQARRKLLEQSLSAGIIDRARFEQCLAESAAEGPGAGLVVSKTRMVGSKEIVDNSGLWEVAGTGYTSSRDAMKDACRVTHGNNNHEWAWNQSGTRKYKRCNFHQDCPVLLRAVQGADELWRQEVLNVSHALERKQHRRVNSPFTQQQEAEIVKMVDQGMKPAQIRDEHTLEAIEAGCTKKNAAGGMEGEYAPDTCPIHARYELDTS